MRHFNLVYRITQRNDYIALREGFNYGFTVDWGDGSPTSVVTSYDDPDRTHVYGTPGNHTVVITGVMETIYFNNGPPSKIRRSRT